jgi:hypothetical protein
MTVWTKTLGIVFVLTAGMVVSAAARLSPQAALEETISGTISATRVITRDARLTGNVVCAMTASSCIQFGASGITLNLNGFTMTGLADPSIGCPEARVPNEFGVDTNDRSDVTILGPGVVQQFRNQGIFVSVNTARARVASVTSSTNCGAGIFLLGSDNLVEGNFLMRNGALAAACGGV